MHKLEYRVFLSAFLLLGSAAAIADPPAQAPTGQNANSAAQHAPPASASDAAEDKALLEQGYKPEMRHGVRYYCRRQAVIGSRFEQTTCLTAEQSRDLRQHSKEMTEHAQRAQGNPIKG